MASALALGSCGIARGAPIPQSPPPMAAAWAVAAPPAVGGMAGARVSLEVAELVARMGPFAEFTAGALRLPLVGEAVEVLAEGMAWRPGRRDYLRLGCGRRLRLRPAISWRLRFRTSLLLRGKGVPFLLFLLVSILLLLLEGLQDLLSDPAASAAPSTPALRG
mmetsp:Transcript_42226/g.105178  ORF Transcript_42226/g.105178 Transcript_42226/m.105178 type:complete len:163 (-) Transcript_42226:376-864(-)